MRKSRLLWILLSVATLAYIAAGLSRISFNVDILRLLPTQLHQVQGLSLFLKNFALPDELIITVEADDPEAAKTAAERISTRLRAETGLVKSAVSQAPWEKSPASLSEFFTFLILNQSRENIAEIRKSLGRSRRKLPWTTRSRNSTPPSLRRRSPCSVTTPLASPHRLQAEPSLREPSSPSFPLRMESSGLSMSSRPSRSAITKRLPNGSSASPG